MSIGNAILNMMGQKDPRTQLLGAALGPGAAQAAAAGGTPAGGAGAPGSAPPPQQPQPQAYQSPQDLMQLYEGLMERQSKASNLDRGIGLIASAFSQPENRANVLNAATGGAGGGGAEDPMASILAIQQSQVAQQQAQQQKALMAQRASGIAKEFGLSEDVAMTLGDAGELPKYLLDQLQYRAPNTEVVKADDGSIRVINKGDGSVVQEVMGPNGQKTADSKNYDRYIEETAARGGEVMPFEDFLTIAPKAGATTITNDLGDKGALTPMQEAIDKNFATVYQDWVGGGFADTQKQLTQLTQTMDLLENGENITGPVQAGLQAVGLDAFLNPNGTIAREGVEEVVQRSLREILGAQFTEKEGERLIARAFNPSLSQQENLRRVKLLFGQIESMGQARQAQVEYASANGTLKGYTGPGPSMNSLLSVERSFGNDPEPTEANRAPSESYQEGDIAKNPNNGERIIFKGGKWEPYNG